MSPDESPTRRRILKLSAVAALPAALAGCNDDNGNGNGENGNDENDDENGNGEPIEPGEIELDGETEAWTGVAPDEIADEENPTLTLEEGESYEITWENIDGVDHNIEIRDDDDEVVDGYETDLMGDEGETQTLEIDEVTDEMTQYVCEPHQSTMIGDVEVV
ncbi:Plastocyanin [Natronorubrum sediminis]|uniref:Plastocyanin n=1 Tax=Natronorubrum sediminis TaxID=640943 RepID=A0A1H6G651_9EURY|nr:plastocyanin/azurin family copper-binding protein [Natronorubrum sediminis]SEH17938.1 Plastocyanin [Natronorubrum sediminis]